MTKFYGEVTPFSTANYSEFANNYIKRATLPTVSPWECHVSNTWQKSQSQITYDDILKDWQKTNEVQLVIGDDGKPKILLVSAPAEHEIAFIDWISFTFKRYICVVCCGDSHYLTSFACLFASSAGNFVFKYFIVLP